MARISVKHVDGRSCVTVSGQLSAADLRRLERACGAALEHKRVELELQLSQVSSMDAAARAFVQRLVDRGAILVDSCSGPSRTRPA